MATSTTSTVDILLPHGMRYDDTRSLNCQEFSLKYKGSFKSVSFSIGGVRLYDEYGHELPLDSVEYRNCNNMYIIGLLAPAFQATYETSGGPVTHDYYTNDMDLYFDGPTLWLDFYCGNVSPGASVSLYIDGLLYENVTIFDGKGRIGLRPYDGCKHWEGSSDWIKSNTINLGLTDSTYAVAHNCALTFVVAGIYFTYEKGSMLPVHIRYGENQGCKLMCSSCTSSGIMG
jgi:hypothetical protein